MVLTKQEFN